MTYGERIKMAMAVSGIEFCDLMDKGNYGGIELCKMLHDEREPDMIDCKIIAKICGKPITPELLFYGADKKVEK